MTALRTIAPDLAKWLASLPVAKAREYAGTLARLRPESAPELARALKAFAEGR